MESEWKVHLIDSLKTNLQEKNKTERVSSCKFNYIYIYINIYIY